jgi:predicted small lipoprotein YifL
MKRRFNAETAVDSLGSQRKTLRDHCASSAAYVLSLFRLATALALAIYIAGCGTKTELLKPDGKPTARDERDPSQPPSPISR